MGKLSPKFEIAKNQFYPTWDRRAGRSLLPFVPSGVTYAELCAGAGDLINQLSAYGLECRAAYDIEPQAPGIVRRNALDLGRDDLGGADMIITNPPWSRDLLHEMIRYFAALAPTWLLFDANWAFSLQSQHLMRFCSMVVPIGKLRWEKGTKDDHKQNSAWFHFPDMEEKDTIFQPRRDWGGPLESKQERLERTNAQLLQELRVDLVRH